MYHYINVTTLKFVIISFLKLPLYSFPLEVKLKTDRLENLKTLVFTCRHITIYQ